MPYLQMRGIAKSYGGVRALTEVDFACERGSIHAVLGENGAGKSTLIKIIAGVVHPDTGSMTLDGNEVRFATPFDANAAGIVCIFQELSLMPDLSVADNICITAPPRTRLGLIDGREQRRRAEALLARVGCEDIDPRERVRNLPLSRRQMVEIAKALGRDPKLLILDEATSALTSSDVSKVYAILRQLRKDGLALLYISHRMHEIKELADTCSVFRNGRHIETFPKDARADHEVVQLMIGREMSHVYPPKPVWKAPPPPVLEVKNLSWQPVLKDISITVGRGEIVGLGGLDGQGQRELLLALFGVLAGVQGEVRVDGRFIPWRPSIGWIFLTLFGLLAPLIRILFNTGPVSLSSPARAKSKGIGMALIPEDRKTEGLMLPMSIGANISMAALPMLTKGLVIDRSKEAQRITDMIQQIQIKIGGVEDPVATLSGGNQQKVVIAKWLMTGARIVLLNDPTRGIDVGTKQELYQLLRRLADQDTAILFYTTDYDELIGSCDRVLILYDGAIVRELVGDQITEHNIVSSSLNLSADIARAAAEARA